MTVCQFLIKYSMSVTDEEKERRLSMQDRILIVDDEDMICRVLVRRLTAEGYACTTAHNGKEGLSYVYKNPFSLIISDIINCLKIV